MDWLTDWLGDWLGESGDDKDRLSLRLRGSVSHCECLDFGRKVCRISQWEGGRNEEGREETSISDWGQKGVASSLPLLIAVASRRPPRTRALPRASPANKRGDGWRGQAATIEMSRTPVGRGGEGIKNVQWLDWRCCSPGTRHLIIWLLNFDPLLFYCTWFVSFNSNHSSFTGFSPTTSAPQLMEELLKRHDVVILCLRSTQHIARF